MTETIRRRLDKAREALGGGARAPALRVIIERPDGTAYDAHTGEEITGGLEAPRAADLTLTVRRRPEAGA